MPGNVGIEASVAFSDGRYQTLNDTLYSLTHVRGFGLTTSYCIIESVNPHIEIISEFMNHDQLSFYYGRDGFYSPTFIMEIFSVSNEIELSSVKTRIVAVEPGFVRLAETDKIRSFPNQKVSDVVGTIASDAGLLPNIKETSGAYTYVQPNISDLMFINKYLLPIATTPSGEAPYLFTIDNGNLYFQPPTLNQKPRTTYVIDPTKDTQVKRITIENSGLSTDFAYGNEYHTYGYNFVNKGLLEHEESLTTVNRSLLNKFSYDSDFFKTEVLPYEEQWMLDAHTKNKLAKGQFIVNANALMLGHPDQRFDTVLGYSIPKFGMEEIAEYTGEYYVFGITNTLETRYYNQHLDLRSNAFFVNYKQERQSLE
jgi:hypothetical protein